MDKATLAHFDRWVEQTAGPLSEDRREAMIIKYDKDPELWASRSWWDLFDATGAADA